MHAAFSAQALQTLRLSTLLRPSPPHHLLYPPPVKPLSIPDFLRIFLEACPCRLSVFFSISRIAESWIGFFIGSLLDLLTLSIFVLRCWPGAPSEATIGDLIITALPVHVAHI